MAAKLQRWRECVNINNLNGYSNSVYELTCTVGIFGSSGKSRNIAAITLPPAVATRPRRIENVSKEAFQKEAV